MIINDEWKVIFIHSPKTAGSSIARMTMGRVFLRSHTTYSEAAKNVSDFNDYFTFSFVRNPWDRLYSYYNFICQKRLIEIERYYPQARFKKIGFKGWLLDEKFWPAWDSEDKNPAHQYRNQIEWLIDDTGEIAVDFVGRFENLSNDWTQVKSLMKVQAGGLPILNKTNRARDYHTVYDNEMIDFVYKHHKADIDAFGYEF